MLKKNITYNDLDGNPITETFYFNLTVAECTKMEVGEAGKPLSEKLQEIIDSSDGQKIIEAMEDIVKKAYGVRSDDGKRLIKTDEAWLEFTQTEAWSALFFEIATNAEKSAEFFQALFPDEVRAKMGELQGQKPTLVVVDESSERLDLVIEELSDEELLAQLGAPEEVKKRDYTKLSKAELRALPRHELVEAFKQRNQQ